MLSILSPSQAAGRAGDEFITAFHWRRHPVLERIRQAQAENTCGGLCSLRFTWSRPKRSASSETEFLYDTFAAMLDGAELLAQAECSRLVLEKVPGMNLLFGLAGFPNGVTAEFELNECLPDTMPDTCFLKANFTHGHVTNQPIVGHFNEEGMLFATDRELRREIPENVEGPFPDGPVEQLLRRFREAAARGLVPPGAFGAARLNKLIRDALK
ncbi:hypothetical protein [uncultured Victivallis sp.]|uniref:hypothetical protein n=1 Tax=uncultured Victivallis sp. TaxID=354118 RepID=UPI00258CE6B6|nr:hypothetical protein [uncultured Victivallis sp.]